MHLFLLIKLVFESLIMFADFKGKLVGYTLIKEQVMRMKFCTTLLIDL